MRLVWKIKTTQNKEINKHNKVIALRYITLMLIWLDVVFRENFTEDKLPVLYRYLS